MPKKVGSKADGLPTDLPTVDNWVTWLLIFNNYIKATHPEAHWVCSRAQALSKNDEDAVAYAAQLKTAAFTKYLREQGIDKDATDAHRKEAGDLFVRTCQETVISSLRACVGPNAALLDHISQGSPTGGEDGLKIIEESVCGAGSANKAVQFFHAVKTATTVTAPSAVDVVSRLTPIATTIGKLDWTADRILCILVIITLSSMANYQQALSKVMDDEAQGLVDTLKILKALDSQAALRASQGSTPPRAQEPNKNKFKNNKGPIHRLASDYPNEDMTGKTVDSSGYIVCSHCRQRRQSRHCATNCHLNPNRTDVQSSGHSSNQRSNAQYRPPPTPPPPVSHTRRDGAPDRSNWNFHAQSANASHSEAGSTVNVLYDEVQDVYIRFNPDGTAYSLKSADQYSSSRVLTVTACSSTVNGTNANCFASDVSTDPLKNVSIIDSAAYPSLTASVNIMRNMRKTNHRIITANSTAPLQSPAIGILELETVTRTGHRHYIKLPNSLYHPKAGNTLLSFAHLLAHGYHPDLAKNRLLTPEGDIISLQFKQGSWLLPPPLQTTVFQPASKPVRPPSALHRPPIIPTSNYYKSLEALEDHSMEGPTAQPIQVQSSPSPALTLHRMYAHPGNRKLASDVRKGKIIAADCTPADIEQLAECADCGIMKPPKIPNSKAHPRRSHSTDRSTHPPPRSLGTLGLAQGECLHLDFAGIPSGPTLFGFTELLGITDDASNARWCIPMKDRKSKSTIEQLLQFQAQSQVKIKMLVMDQEYMSTELQQFASRNHIALRPSPPRTHQSNGRAENTVDRIKTTARVQKQCGGASGTYLLPWAASHGPKMLNRVRTDADPQNLGRTPLEIWPNAPYQHPHLAPHPLFCRMFLKEKNRTDRDNMSRRARPGIYVGMDHTHIIGFY